ncbi:MAG: Gfo/Idh/MocA family oxidoreductase [Verrucomicrobiae bacterium]|nr:Gfo/Idh/MocA family oxidoreductase [Verrucomicrobiae bacterium]
MTRNEPTTITRRRFLKTSLLYYAAFARFIPGSRANQIITHQPSPTTRINLLFIGVGFRGTELLRAFLRLPDCRVAAVCDVDQQHAELARSFVNRHYGNNDCRVYYDFREPLARPDLDAAVIALPLHWHSIPAITALKAGLDVYAEPPLAHTIKEGRTICNTVERYARVWQTGTWRQADPRFKLAIDLIRKGHIGTVRSVEIGVPDSFVDCAGTAGQDNPAKPPPGLDYDMWLGPAPWAPYAPARVHGNWRWHTDYGGGQLMEWIGHYMDIVQSSMSLDKTGPTQIHGTGQAPTSGLWNAITKFRVHAVYNSGLTITVAAGDPQIPLGISWKGENGFIYTGPEKFVTQPPLPEPTYPPSQQQLPPLIAHCRDFIDCIRSRKRTTAPVEHAQRAATIGHLGQIAIKLAKTLHWNPETEEFVGDQTANRFLNKTMREPWYI